jgi:hypothetical protein
MIWKMVRATTYINDHGLIGINAEQNITIGVIVALFLSDPGRNVQSRPL